MSDNRWCHRCGAFMLHGACRCRKFVLKVLEDGEPTGDEHEIYAMDAEAAAEKVAERCWDSDPYDPEDVHEVYEIEGKKYEVTAQVDVQFSVKELED